MAAPRSDGVPQLRVLELEPDLEIVAELEELLLAARRGEILAIAVATQLRGGFTGHSLISTHGDRAHLLAAIDRLRARVVG